MRRKYKGRGIVLGTVKYGDSSLVAQLLTDVGGRQSYMVQGVRSSRGRGSKLALFQPLFALEFEGVEPSRGELHRFGEVRSGITLGKTPFDVRRSTIALFMAEVLYRLIKESEANEPLFDFVWGCVEALDRIDEGVANFHLWFLSNLSRFLGFSPANNYSKGSYFDIKEGCYTLEKPSHTSIMQADNALILRDMIECDVRHLGEIGLNRHQRVSFLEALMQYYGYHLESIHSVRSISILMELF
ncbi:MAG: DNA repair protein RecO C-terminal domain-containing protein [Rikenellaceae bacterium]